jgi:hypothetical protein
MSIIIKDEIYKDLKARQKLLRELYIELDDEYREISCQPEHHGGIGWQTVEEEREHSLKMHHRKNTILARQDQMNKENAFIWKLIKDHYSELQYELPLQEGKLK